MPAPKKSRPFTADRHDLDLLATMVADKNLRRSSDVRIESSAESAICRNHDEEDPLLGPHLEERMREVLLPRRQISEDHLQLVCIRSCAEYTLLRAPQLRGRDGFHGLGQLLRILNGADPATDI